MPQFFNLDNADRLSMLQAQPVRWRYALAVGAALIGVVVRFLLNSVLGDDVPLILSIIAVVVAAWYGGFFPGLLATLISVAGGILLFLPPDSVHPLLTASQVLRLLFFLLTGSVISGLMEALFRTTAGWRRAEEENERQILQERNRMAREIHDTLAQGLTGIIIQLEAVEDMLGDDPEEARGHLHRAGDLARQSLSEARHSVQALRPEILNQRGLPLALAHYIEQMSVRTGVRVDLAVDGVPPAPGSLPPEIDANILRIALEAVTNALKHARPASVHVQLSYEPTNLRLVVRDDGLGFSRDAELPGAGFGMTTMAERADRIHAELEIVSEPGTGTTVSVVAPFAPTAASTRRRKRR
jgi:signal transduction histidine kinase